MKSIYLLIIFIFCSLGAKAQLQPVRNSIRLGIDVVPIDGLEMPALRYQIRYAKHLLTDRLLIGTSVGYLRGNAKEKVREVFYIDGNSRRRITGDINVLVDLLPSSRYALRLGGGPSLLYRQDNVITSLSYNIDQSGSVDNVQIKREDREGFLLGYHLLLEYEYAITTRLALGGRIGWTDAKRDSPLIQAGLGVNYSFR